MEFGYPFGVDRKVCSKAQAREVSARKLPWNREKSRRIGCIPILSLPARKLLYGPLKVPRKVSGVAGDGQFNFGPRCRAA